MKNEFYSLVRRKVLEEKATKWQRLDSVSKKILRRFIEEMKSPEVFSRLEKKMNSEIVISSDEVGIPVDLCDYIKLNFVFNSQLGEQEVAIDASFSRSGILPNIVINLNFPMRRFRVEDISDLYPEILEPLRHELEHIFQNIPVEDTGIPEEMDTLEDYKRYYLEPTEVAAHISGFMSKSKNIGMNLSDLIDQKIDNIVADAEDSGLKEKEIEDLDNSLRKAYHEYARQRYPMMR